MDQQTSQQTGVMISDSTPMDQQTGVMISDSFQAPMDQQTGVMISDSFQAPMDQQTGVMISEDYGYGPFYPPPYPAGIRFNPTDEELIVHYLNNKVRKRRLPCNVVHEANLYQFNPQELTATIAPGAEGVWYVFTPRDRKYAKGGRPNRSTKDGYWKATGADQHIISSEGRQIGFKKALVYHIGKQPNGLKTGWMMHEYRIAESQLKVNQATRSMLLDKWVLCKLYHKANADPLPDVPFADGELGDLPFGAENVDYEAPLVLDDSMFQC